MGTAWAHETPDTQLSVAPAGEFPLVAVSGKNRSTGRQTVNFSDGKKKAGRSVAFLPLEAPLSLQDAWASGYTKFDCIWFRND